MQAARFAFYSSDRGAVTSLKKLLLRMQRMDTRRTTRAIKAGKNPVVFANAENVTAAMETLLARCNVVLPLKV